ncbi:MAG: NYN domain-containing protein [Gammaproteobacteria bacterium]|nr:NYN domain-containing protein [Gammaproteobacteria bacterium]
MNNSERVYCYVDGYNLYRSTRELVIKMGHLEQIWYDLIKLAELFIDDNQDISRVYYCSAPYSFRGDKIQMPQKVRESRQAQHLFCQYHQRLYGKERFKIKFGYFAPISSDSGKPLFREKQTDVNLALLALDDAHRDLYDHAYIVSGDGDFAPLGRFIQRMGKKISFILPPGASNHRLAKKFTTHQINGGHIKSSQFNPGENAPNTYDIY